MTGVLKIRTTRVRESTVSKIADDGEFQFKEIQIKIFISKLPVIMRL